MKFPRFILVLLAAATFAGGCTKKKEITSLQRKQAELFANEAQFASSLRNWAEAEEKLMKATELSPDVGPLWVSLGATRMRLNKRDAAKAAYKQALSAYEAEAASAKTISEPWLQQVFVLALLGRVDDSRALLQKITKRFPDDRRVRAFVDEKHLEAALADPKFKETAL